MDFGQRIEIDRFDENPPFLGVIFQRRFDNLAIIERRQQQAVALRRVDGISNVHRVRR